MSILTVAEPETLSVQYLSAEDISTAASLIYQAYHDDPVLKNVLGFQKDSPSKYETKLRALVREELASFWQEKQPLIGLYSQSRLKAIACVFDSASELQAERYWHWRLKLMLSAGYLQTNQLIEKERTIREALSSKGHYLFLAFIAVDPHFQGQGLGRYLLRGLNDLVESSNQASGLAVFVTRPEQREFFSSEGFDVFKGLSFNQVEGDLMFKAAN
ncbi:GNAT family N-acetyltransferase [Pseudoalteromonas apostichopi]|uniref:GNAT family N-acetyltransferase n=1 Tax=Pseudoalteromonas apostichopi TaxID=3035452 RepID=UPI002574727E|nr:GNAT family N-acetyltransferase [Pseudoalteromonas sp. FE4]